MLNKKQVLTLLVIFSMFLSLANPISIALANDENRVVDIFASTDIIFFKLDNGDIYASGSNSNNIINQEDDAKLEYHVPVKIEGLPSNIVKIVTHRGVAIAITSDGQAIIWGKGFNFEDRRHEDADGIVRPTKINTYKDSLIFEEKALPSISDVAYNNRGEFIFVTTGKQLLTLQTDSYANQYGNYVVLPNYIDNRSNRNVEGVLGAGFNGRDLFVNVSEVQRGSWLSQCGKYSSEGTRHLYFKLSNLNTGSTSSFDRFQVSNTLYNTNCSEIFHDSTIHSIGVMNQEIKLYQEQTTRGYPAAAEMTGFRKDSFTAGGVNHLNYANGAPKKDKFAVQYTNDTMGVLDKLNRLTVFGTSNSNYKQGREYSIGSYYSSAYQTPILSNVDKFMLGLDFGVAKTFDGRVFVWGKNHVGQLGLNHTDNVSSPTQIVISENTVTTPSQPQVTETVDYQDNAATITFEWDEVDGAEQYIIEKNEVELETITSGQTNYTYTDTDINHNGTYEYTFYAENDAGRSEPYVTTLDVDYPAPDIPTNLTATDVQAEQVTLNWDASNYAMTYVVKQDGQEIATTTSNTSYVVTGLNANTNYAFQVVAKNAHKESSPASLDVTTAGYIPSKPTVNVTATTASIILDWSSQYAESYQITRDGVEIVTNTTDTSYEDTGLANGTLYTYKVTAINGEGSAESDDLPIATKLEQPVVQGEATGSDSVDLTWNAVPNATEYEIKRNGATVTTVTGTSFTDSGLQGATTYTYVVVAKNAHTSTDSESVSITTEASAPSKPVLSSTDQTSVRVTLQWTAADQAISYNVERDGQIVYENIIGTSFEDTGLSQETTYTYRVIAVNPYGETPSESIQVTTNAQAQLEDVDIDVIYDEESGTYSVELRFKVPEGVVKFTIKRNPTFEMFATETPGEFAAYKNGEFLGIAIVDAEGYITLTEVDAPANKELNYTIVGENEDGEVTAPITVTTYTMPQFIIDWYKEDTGHNPLNEQDITDLSKALDDVDALLNNTTIENVQKAVASIELLVDGQVKDYLLDLVQGFADTIAQGKFNVTITEGKVPTTKTIRWANTAGNAKIELRKDGVTEFEQDTIYRRATFDNLEEGATYEIWITGLHSGEVLEVGVIEIEPEVPQNDASTLKVKVEHTSDTSVRVTWEGTTNAAVAELKVDGMKTHEVSSIFKRATFSKLELATYHIFINGMDAEVSFTIEGTTEDDTSGSNNGIPSDLSQLNLTVTDVNPTSKRLDWENTAGNVKVELSKDGEVTHSLETIYRRATFSNLEEGIYQIFLNGMDVETSFTIDEILDDGSGQGDNGLPDDTSTLNITVTDGNVPTTKNIRWDNSQGVVLIELKQEGETMNEQTTFYRRGTFTNMEEGIYELYLNGVDTDFQIVVKIPEPIEEEPEEVDYQAVIEEGNNASSKMVNWSNTQGTTVVDLVQEGEVIRTSSTIFTRVTFSNLVNGIYRVFINGEDTGVDMIVSASVIEEPEPTSDDYNIRVTEGRTPATQQVNWDYPVHDVLVQIKLGGELTGEVTTSFRRATFTNLVDGEYAIFFNNEDTGRTFTVEGGTKEEEEEVTPENDWKATIANLKNQTSKRLNWTPTGTVTAELRQGEEVFQSVTTGMRRATFTKLVEGEIYEIYIGEDFIGYLTLGGTFETTEGEELAYDQETMNFYYMTEEEEVEKEWFEGTLDMIVTEQDE